MCLFGLIWLFVFRLGFLLRLVDLVVTLFCLG